VFIEEVDIAGMPELVLYGAGEYPIVHLETQCQAPLADELLDLLEAVEVDVLLQQDSRHLALERFLAAEKPYKGALQQPVFRLGGILLQILHHIEVQDLGFLVERKGFVLVCRNLVELTTTCEAVIEDERDVFDCALVTFSVGGVVASLKQLIQLLADLEVAHDLADIAHPYQLLPELLDHCHQSTLCFM
jgi:hypothetical protein